MNKIKTGILTGIAALVLTATPVRGQVENLYDDFESGVLDSSKWTVMQDPEGQPLMEEYGILDEGASNVYHMQTTNGGRTAIVPTHEFMGGDTLEYQVNHVSGAGNRGNLLVIEGINNDYYSRHGIIDTNSGSFDFGNYNITLRMNFNDFEIIREAEDGSISSDTLPLAIPGGKYRFYIETWADDDAHFDYDNFSLIINRPIANEELSWGDLKSRFR